MDCQKENNLKTCPCTYLPAGRHGPGCSRKGICCECTRHHLINQELPGCYFSKEVEKTYDRSFARFIQENKN